MSCLHTDPTTHSADCGHGVKTPGYQHAILSPQVYTCCHYGNEYFAVCHLHSPSLLTLLVFGQLAFLFFKKYGLNTHVSLYSLICSKRNKHTLPARPFCKTHDKMEKQSFHIWEAFIVVGERDANGKVDDEGADAGGS